MALRMKIRWLQHSSAVICINNLELRDGASIFTAELQAIKMAFNFILNDSRGVNYVIYLDSLSSLKALDGAHFNHPYIYDIRLPYQLPHTTN